VDEGIDAGDVLQPQTERDQRMPWRQLRIVIIGAAIRASAAVGRQRHNDITERLRAKAERAAAQMGIVGRLAPNLMKLFDGGSRHAF
jgi:hypothetical protein